MRRKIAIRQTILQSKHKSIELNKWSDFFNQVHIKDMDIMKAVTLIFLLFTPLIAQAEIRLGGVGIISK